MEAGRVGSGHAVGGEASEEQGQISVLCQAVEEPKVSGGEDDGNRAADDRRGDMDRAHGVRTATSRPGPSFWTAVPPAFVMPSAESTPRVSCGPRTLATLPVRSK